MCIQLKLDKRVDHSAVTNQLPMRLPANLNKCTKFALNLKIFCCKYITKLYTLFAAQDSFKIQMNSIYLQTDKSHKSLKSQALNPKCSNSVHKLTKDKFIRICMCCAGVCGCSCV